ncbi:MAG: zinc chelation protein SecC [Merismopedia sp. SIO2A8]|nr:zinc chelation protein SecC [Merismopedia sp. SIO2A8]
MDNSKGGRWVVTRNVEYLVTTHHPSKRSLNERDQIRQSISTTKWLGLTIIATEAGQPTDEKGIVEFVALYQPKSGQVARSKGKSSQLHERSNFIKRRERWFYLDGKQLPPLMPKRNDPCWCGSQKKFKHCHGR